MGSLMKDSWNPEKEEATNTSKYWLNWRVLLCSVWVLISMIVASYIIAKYEGYRNSKTSDDSSSAQNGGEDTARKEEQPGTLYADEVWKPCVKGMHPGWLLGFRVCGFFVLLTVLIVNAIVDGPTIFYYYTQWTFTLVTLYFGLGSVLSMYGCIEYHNQTASKRVDNNDKQIDPERGHHAAKNTVSSTQVDQARRFAGFWGFALQIMYQMSGGAVVLTDSVFWFVLAPFLKKRNYDFNFFIINMHSINLVFLAVDAALNCLRFPWFRISYFMLWTAFYVIFQWLLHASISIWWPYPFLELSSSFAPLWYSSVAIMHFPCYGFFFLMIKLKHKLLKKYFPETYQCFM